MLFVRPLPGWACQTADPQPSNFGRDAPDLAAALRESGFEVMDVQTREMVAVLEGGVPQALGAATAASGIRDLPPDQADAARAAIAVAIKPLVKDGAVHLLSISTIAAARRPN